MVSLTGPLAGRLAGHRRQYRRSGVEVCFGALSVESATADPPVLLDEGAITRAADAIAADLSTRVAAGEPIALLCGTRPEMVAARDAAAIRRLAAVPLYPQLAPPEIAFILAHARPRVLLVETSLRGAAAQALDRLLPARRPILLDIPTVPGLPLGSRASGIPTPRAIGATLLYTSGTTGRPKGCVRTAEQEEARAAELIQTYSLGRGDTHLIACPLAFSAPGILLRAARRAGAATVLLSRFTPAGFLAAAAASRATVFFLVPTQVQRLLALSPEERARFDLSAVRAAIVAGAPMPPALRRAAVDWLGPGRLWEFYGSSETGTITVLRPEEQLLHPDSVGHPIDGVELRLTRPPGDPTVPAEIFVRSPTVMAGYWNPVTGSVDWPGTSDGYLSVGDLGERQGEGPLRLVDRLHDTIISGGVNVYPAEVERALHEHPEVAGAVVFGVADPDWHQRVAAVVVRAHGSSVDEEALRAFLRDRMAPHKIPKQIAFIAADELPRSPSGKPLRRAAAALLRR